MSGFIPPKQYFLQFLHDVPNEYQSCPQKKTTCELCISLDGIWKCLLVCYVHIQEGIESLILLHACIPLRAQDSWCYPLASTPPVRRSVHMWMSKYHVVGPINVQDLVAAILFHSPQLDSLSICLNIMCGPVRVRTWCLWSSFTPLRRQSVHMFNCVVCCRIKKNCLKKIYI